MVEKVIGLQLTAVLRNWGFKAKWNGLFVYLASVLMEWFGNKNPQLLKAGGTLPAILDNRQTNELDNITNQN